MKVTNDQIEVWLGNDLDNAEVMLSLLRTLINGDYPVKQLRKEVLDFSKEK